MEELQQNLKAIILKHLSRLEQYSPAHGRGVTRLTAAELRETFAKDPVYSIFGLDSPEYIAATLAGGTITSIHRKIGDAYEECIRTIFLARYRLTPEQARYTAVIPSGDRQRRRGLDVYLALNDLQSAQRESWARYAQDCLEQISPAPQVRISVINRYRSLWIVTEGLESYELARAQTGFDFYAFLLTNKEEFRQPVVRMLKRLREET